MEIVPGYYSSRGNQALVWEKAEIFAQSLYSMTFRRSSSDVVKL